MALNSDKVIGRIKQAIGALAGDKKLKREGRADERAGATKDKASETIDKVRDGLGKS
jgi:uncharacterized protein YjbJ (UPF0337 family)